MKKKSFYQKYIKRFLDLFLSLFAIILFSPLLIILALLIKIKIGSPVIFKQRRPGKNEEIFYLYKFRTMTEEKDKEGNYLPDDLRITKFGKFLRSTSLDELPELFNILRGNMSIVGPRPLLEEYLPYYTEKERLRHSVRPGLTGLAQINGRNNISWELKFEIDLEYINSISFTNDLKIVIGTIIKTLKRSDILVGSEIPAGRLDNARKKTISQSR